MSHRSAEPAHTPATPPPPWRKESIFHEVEAGRPAPCHIFVLGSFLNVTFLHPNRHALARLDGGRAIGTPTSHSILNGFSWAKVGHRHSPILRRTLKTERAVLGVF